MITQNMTQKNPKIIHFCHSPTRYLHGLTTELDHQALPYILRLFLPIFKFFLRRFDLQAAHNLTSYGAIWLGNSSYITQTIQKIYQVEAITVFPPTETKKFADIIRRPIINLEKTKKAKSLSVDSDTNQGASLSTVSNTLSSTKSSEEEFYLFHSRLSFHKRVDIAILACLKLKKNLKISGTSPNQEFVNYLKNITEKYIQENPEEFENIPNGGRGLIQFLGRTTDQEYKELLERCMAVLYPPKEDFGIAPIEFISAGVPILAYGEGGALDWCKTDGEMRNGILFYEQTPEALMQAIQKYEDQIADCQAKNISILDLYSPSKMRAGIKIFDEESHEKAIRELAGF